MDLSFNSVSGKLSSMLFEYVNSMKVLNEKMTYMETILIWEMYWSDSRVGYYDYSMKITNKGMERIYSKISNIFRGIDLSNNHFEGEIPTSIGNLKGLHLLSLGNNNFTGSIPSSFGNLQQLESLDLSRNKLSGKIPPELVQLNFLSFFDVSFNNLSGPIPHGGQFDTSPNRSYEGNPLAFPQLSPPPSKSDDPEDSEGAVFDKIEWMIILIGFGGGLVVGVVLRNEFWMRKPYWFVKLFGRRTMVKWLSIRRLGRGRQDGVFKGSGVGGDPGSACEGSEVNNRLGLLTGVDCLKLIGSFYLILCIALRTEWLMCLLGCLFFVSCDFWNSLVPT